MSRNEKLARETVWQKVHGFVRAQNPHTKRDLNEALDTLLDLVRKEAEAKGREEGLGTMHEALASAHRRAEDATATLESVRKAAAVVVRGTLGDDLSFWTPEMRSASHSLLTKQTLALADVLAVSEGHE